MVCERGLQLGVEQENGTQVGVVVDQDLRVHEQEGAQQPCCASPGHGRQG